MSTTAMKNSVLDGGQGVVTPYILAVCCGSSLVSYHTACEPYLSFTYSQQTFTPLTGRCRSLMKPTRSRSQGYFSLSLEFATNCLVDLAVAHYSMRRAGGMLIWPTNL